ncbi:PGF-CTERM sorting domain-containing protein [Natronosalvus vescus]|uniref:PGF-CTERM sorting domain-containing protein n=1 Tax=Natronosalvus vescus TaxID=2953881 RepID=UPI002090CEF3|nr:PGF-CTERM sorting domain-containing protein [Natronosalvus vescus]
MDTPSRSWRTVLLAVGASLVIAAIATGLLVSSGSLAPVASDPGNDTVSEEAAELEVPEPGDEWFEAQAADGSWISYINPRDEYRSPYLGDGSGKICVTLLNEAGDPIVGESVPGTTVTVPTGDSLDWHSGADPMTVQYPLTDHYDRPLDSDQFGTADHVPQGDGYLDSHCIEFHGFDDDGDEVTYGEAVIDGAHADHIEVIGYIQQDDQAWDTDLDPLEAAVPYEDADGGWVYQEPLSHGQVVVVLQLTGDAPVDDGADDSGSNADSDDETNDDDSSSDDGEDDDTSGVPGEGDDDATGNENTGDDDDANDSATDGSSDTESGQGDSNGTDDSTDDADADGLSGFGSLVALTALAALLVALARTPRGS